MCVFESLLYIFCQNKIIVENQRKILKMLASWEVIKFSLAYVRGKNFNTADIWQMSYGLIDDVSPRLDNNNE